MTPDDLAALLRWLYAKDDGSGWLPAAAVDLRIEQRNLRGMLSGKVPIPVTVGKAVAVLVAGHAVLHGWADRPLPQLPPIGDEARQLLATWLEAGNDLP